MRTGLAPSIFAAVLLLGDAPLAPPACAQPPSAASAVETAYQAILANPKVIKTLEDIKADDDTALAEQKRITEIPAPPYKEKIRAEYYLKRFQELALKDAFIDTEGNVIGIPAVTIGGGGEGGNWHSRNEWYKPVDAYFGPQNALLTILMLTGLDGVTKPALPVRQGK